MWDEPWRRTDVVDDLFRVRAHVRTAEAHERVVNDQVCVAVEKRVNLLQEAPVALAQGTA